MRIDSDDLKALYQAHVRSKTLSSLKDCPSPKKMMRLLRSKSSAKEATQIVDHISRCSSCFCEFEFLVDVLRKEKEFIREVEQLVQSREARVGRKADCRTIFGLRMGWRPLLSRLSWRTAFFLAGFVLAGFLVSKLVLFRAPEKYRTGTSAGFELIQPVAKRIPRSSLVFKWEEVEDSEYYILELFDQALTPIWKSGKINEKFAVLPEGLTRMLETDRSYFWMVTACKTTGEKITSRLEEFSLIEDQR
jgi:hypothetical protein